MKTLQVYYAKQFLSYTGFSLTLFVAIFVGIDLFEQPEVVEKGWQPFLRYLVQKLPEMLYHLQAICLFLGNMMVLTLIFTRRESVTIFTSGIRLIQVYWPILLLTLGCTVSINGLYDQFSPMLNESRQVDSARLSIKNLVQVNLLDDRIWYRFNSGIYRLGSIDPRQKTIQNIHITLLDPAGSPQLIIQAAQAKVKDHTWMFTKGKWISYRDNTVNTVEPFDQKRFELPQGWTDVNKITLEPDHLSAGTLWAGLKNERFSASKTHHYKTALYNKLVFLLLPFLLLFVGAPLVMINSRNVSVFKNAFLAAGLCVAFWVFHQIFVSVGQVGSIPPLIAVSVMPILFLLLGGFFWFKKI